MQWEVLHGDCREKLRDLPDASIDAIVTDPPYELGFMGKAWDASGIAYDVGMWREALRVLKPGGHLLAFSGSRTYHRMTVAIEDAGFEIRDQIMWVYGSGFPKSLDVSKAIDKAAGVEREIIGPNKFSHLNGKENLNCYGAASRPDETRPATDAARQWQGWGTALKPAHEPICVARKPLIGTVAENVLAHGTGALNIDASRVAIDLSVDDPRLGGNGAWTTSKEQSGDTVSLPRGTVASSPLGRWPANLIHDGSDEVLALAGEAARFFYCPKASKADRAGSKHPTVKPIALMAYLVRLVTPPGGTVLDLFAGSGTTLEAAVKEGFRVIGIEQDETYIGDIFARMERLRDREPANADLFNVVD